MKNSKVKVALLFLLVSVLVLSFTGCHPSPEQNPKKAVVFVVGNTANSQPINWSSPLIQDTVYNCIRNYGFISVINTDGKSEIVGSENFDIDDKRKDASEDRLEKDAQIKKNNVIQYMQGVVADDPEVDYLEGITQASRILSGLDTSYTSKEIVVLGSALSTCGYMNFQNNLISAEPSTIADLLEEKQAIPNLTGSVTFQGIGDVSSPQPNLSPAQRNNLISIWEEVINRAGGTFVCNEYVSNSENPETEYPYVSVIDLPKEAPISFDSNEMSLENPLKLTDEQISFVADSSDYIDESKTLETLQPIVDYLNTQKNTKILLAGTSAGDIVNPSTLELSSERAQKVKKTMTDLGIDPNRIQTIGLSCDNPWHIPGGGDEGPIASSNRAVYVLDASSEQAKELLNR